LITFGFRVFADFVGTEENKGLFHAHHLLFKIIYGMDDEVQESNFEEENGETRCIIN